MTPTSPDLPRPDRRGFSRDSYDVGHNHRDAAKTSSQRRQRRALQLLASSPFGVAEVIMLAHGFTHRMIASLSRAGFATAQGTTVTVSDKAITVGRVKITDAGRRALEG
jgi:hypothetical protein